jgi:hypothetical protein
MKKQQGFNYGFWVVNQIWLNLVRNIGFDIRRTYSNSNCYNSGVQKPIKNGAKLKSHKSRENKINNQNYANNRSSSQSP